MSTADEAAAWAEQTARDAQRALDAELARQQAAEEARRRAQSGS